MELTIRIVFAGLCGAALITPAIYGVYFYCNKLITYLKNR